jgi:predicted glutamine amidotransferase
MLIALGDVNVSSLLDGLIYMAKDESHTHERNEKQGWKHDGGWGIAYLKNNKWVVEKSTKAIFDDPSVNKFRDIKTNLVILHARKVTIGKVSMPNTHPFQFEDFIFCHNGTVRDKIRCSPEFKVKGDTDSEHLFYSVLTEKKKEENTLNAIRKNLKKYQNYEGSNIILANKNKSYVFIKENKQPVYYQMQLAQKDDSLIISSERLPQLSNTKWEKLEQEDLVVIDNKTLQVEINRT